MAISTKAIKGRIKSVKNTKKITKAMEMVSAAKMRRAVEAVLNTRMYAGLAKDLMHQLGTLREKEKYALLKIRPVQNFLVVLVSSNRGLCGSFNANIFKKTQLLLNEKHSISQHRISGAENILPEGEVNIHIIGIGKKSAAFAKKHGYNLVAVFDELGEKPSFEEIIPISSMMIEAYKTGQYDKIAVAYTDYRSSLVQEAKMRQLLPISEHDIEKMTEQFHTDNPSQQEVAQDDYPMERYLLEPNVDTIVEYVLPRLVEVQLYQAILESSASEHSARMIAMKNASESAQDMIKQLTLEFNKGRQAGITREIAEIVGGAVALE